MNTDRLLTRVFDKQEKKMLYEGDTFHHIAYPKNKLLFKTVHKNGLLCHVAGNSFDDPWNDIIATIEFSDRFVPMMCRGLLSKNKKMIYEDDIGHIEGVFGDGTDRIIAIDNGRFCFKNKDNDVIAILYDNLAKYINIIGNRWENEKLLEAKA